MKRRSRRVQQRRKHQVRQQELRNYHKQTLLEEEQALEIISRFKKHLSRRDVFLADLSELTTAEVRLVIGETNVTEYQNRFSNMTCHDICIFDMSPNGHYIHFRQKKPFFNKNIIA